MLADQVVGADGSRSVVGRALDARYGGARQAGRTSTSPSAAAAGRRIPFPPAVQHWVLNPGLPGVIGPLELVGTWWAIATGTEPMADDEEAAGSCAARRCETDEVEVLATDPWQARMLLADR